MVVQANCQIVVAYRDSNYMWKDRALSQLDIAETVVSPTERAIHCFIPHFWGRFAQPSRIERVTITQQGHTFRLAWEPKMNLATPSAVSMNICLHYNGQSLLTGVTWK